MNSSFQVENSVFISSSLLYYLILLLKANFILTNLNDKHIVRNNIKTTEIFTNNLD